MKYNKSKKIRKNKNHKRYNKSKKHYKLTKCKICGKSHNYCNHKCKICSNKNIKYGGTGCGNTGCPIAPYPMTKGGCMGTCLVGGSSNNLQTFVGSPWEANMKWPGIDGPHNHYALNNYNIQPDRMTQLQDDIQLKQTGGKRTRKFRKNRNIKKKYKGGFLMNDLTTFVNKGVYNIQSTYNTLNGIEQPTNPLPFEDQFKQI